MQRRLAPENDYRALAMVEPGEPRLSVAVVIPAFERPELLRRTLRGLAVQQAYPQSLISVVVADDGSEADIAGVVGQSGLNAAYVRQDHEGYGAGRARNLGAAATTADVLLLLDADCLPVPDLVARHMAWHHRSAEAVVIGARRFADTSALDPDAAGYAARIWQLGSGTGPDDWRSVLYRRTNGLAHGTEAFRAFLSGNVSVRRSRFSAAGGFSDTFTSWGGEDTELGWRLFQEGLWFIPESKAVIYHQQQEESHPGDWREASRKERTDLLTSKIPHGYYRNPTAKGSFEVPKVSVVVAPRAAEQARVLAGHLIRQRSRDWEARFPLDPGLDLRDPRIKALPDEAGTEKQRFLRAIAASSGEYIAVLAGGAVPHPELLTRCTTELDATPRASIATVSTAGADRTAADRRLGSWGMPAFAMVRRREFSKVLPDHQNPEAVWSIVLELSRTRYVPDPLLIVPDPESGPSRVDLQPLPGGVRPDLMTRLRTRLAATLRRSTKRKPVVVHLGDSTGAEALAALAPWARVVEGRRGRAVVVTGTLDDRTFAGCFSMDEPRVERVVIGGTAGGGPATDWADFLRTCLFVGLASGDDVATVRAWGYSGAVAVTGPIADGDEAVDRALATLEEALA
jgi:GT2 family glycosyltransferase